MASARPDGWTRRRLRQATTSSGSGLPTFGAMPRSPTAICRSRSPAPPNSLRMILEIIVQSLDDARAALEGGADRLEGVRAIEDGGLTPPLELVHEIAAHVGLPLRVMVRENAGFRIHEGELDRLQRAAY